MGRWVRRGLVALLLAPVVAWAALPWPVAYRWVEPRATAVMRYRVQEARAAGEELELRHEWVPLARISAQMVRAVIASEDGRFREHNGIDWIALGEELRYQGELPFSWKDKADLFALAGSGRYYLENRSEVRGRSTITQQLAKNLYWSPERSLARKGAEMFVARRLEKFLSKDRILELYLNTVELGPGIFGVEAAAQAYFDRSAAELTTFQAASLAATLPHPLTSNPEHRPGRMAWRRDRIMRRLRGEDSGLSGIPEQPAPLELPDAGAGAAQDEAPDGPSGEAEPGGDAEDPQAGAGADPDAGGEPGAEPPEPTAPAAATEPAAPVEPPAEPAPGPVVPDTAGVG